jgi:hypothetical protein
MKRQHWLTISALGLILLVGAALRLYRLDRHSITHVEMYVPGINLPADLVEFPLPRLTLTNTLSGCIRTEPHPPLYYALMFFWTYVFGTGPIALRLPSALCGLAIIPAVYALGKREHGNATGLMAAGLFALNGHQIYWSQFRSYAPASFLGIIATLLLVKLSQGAPRPSRSIFLFCLFTFMGLATEVFFWPIFLTQMLWVAGKGITQARVPALLRWQLWIFLCASPLCALAAHQSRLPSHGGVAVSQFVRDLFQFGFLFEGDHSRVAIGPVATAAVDLLAVAGFLLTLVGLTSSAKLAAGTDSIRGEGTDRSILPEPPGWMWVFGGLAALVGILALGACSYLWGGQRTAAILATIVIPAVLVLTDLLLRRYWPFLHRNAPIMRIESPIGIMSLSGLLAVLPVTMILVGSILISLLTPRGALIYTPYLVITASRGLVALIRVDRRSLVLATAIATAHVGSAMYWYHLPLDRRDYRDLSQELATRVKETDLIFVWGKIWPTTPIFYYLNADRYHFVGTDYARAISSWPDARVWTVAWEDGKILPEMADALKGYRATEEVSVRGAHAVLRERTLPIEGDPREPAGPRTPVSRSGVDGLDSGSSGSKMTIFERGSVVRDE